MEKVTLFENLLNAPKETRDDTIDNFAALMGVDDFTVNILLTMYCAARRKNANEITLELRAGHIRGADAARILDAAGVRSILVDGESTATLKIVCGFLSAGWQASAVMIFDFVTHDDSPVLRLSRA